MPLENKVKIFREKLNISQTDLGKLCSVSRQTISSIERGDYHPSIVVALKLTKIFGCSVEDIFKYEESVDNE
ncbi:MAG: helix-turn-helix transcriptional regulator [Clostridia bacterium]